MDMFDLLIVGGGINGAAIARDAAIRGLKVLLVEKDDLAAHTSSASSKLIHGGLRYLEQREFRLVRESLREREILLRTAPHIVRPLRFLVPQAPGLRPRWLVRAGLLLYDLMSLRGSLPRSRSVAGSAALKVAAPLLSYWDAWVDDSRLVVLNALDAAEHGAEIATRTELLSAHVQGEAWRADLGDGRTVSAKGLVNAAGPWVSELLGNRLRRNSAAGARLIRGSHIVVPRLAPGDDAFLLQQPDGRVVFALPSGDYTMIGTTDVPVDRPDDAAASDDEVSYLCAAANLYFAEQIDPADVVWRFAGIRALYDDGAAAAQEVTRDYRLDLSDGPGPTLLSVFGGKITTARALAEEALEKLGFGARSPTAALPLPGGSLDAAFSRQLEELRAWVPEPLLTRLARAYGTRIGRLLGEATSIEELGRHFGAGLYEAEVRYLLAHEFARTADDILWRRTKLGLVMTAEERKALERYLSA